MSYISHVDYKKMMDGFKKGAPKQMLKEDFERPDAREMGEEDELGRITDAVERVFTNDQLTSKEDVDALAEEIRNAWSKSRGYGQGDEIDFVAEYLTDWAKDVRQQRANMFGDPSKATGAGPEQETVWGANWKNWIMDAVHKSDMEEGNAFTAGLAKAKKGQEFKVGGKSVKDTSNYDASMDESHPGNDQWYEEFQAAISGMGLAGDAEARVMKALDHTDPMTQYGTMSAGQAAAEFVNDLGVTDDYEPDTDADYEEPRDDFDMAGDFNDGEFWENEIKKLQEIAGIKSHDDGPEDEKSEEERESGRKKREIDDEEAENAERDEVDEEAHADGSHMRNPDTVAKVVAEKHGAELKPLYDTYQAAHEQYIQDIRSKKPNQQELSKAFNKLVKEFQNEAISWAGREMLEAGMNKVQVRNLLSGYGSFEDWLSDYITAIGKELKGVSGKEKAMYADTDPNLADPIKEGSTYEDPYTLAKAVAQAHPELQRFALEDRKMFHKAAFKYANEMMVADGVSKVAITNLIGGYADEDWPSDYISALGKELDGMEEGLHMPPLQATGQTIMANEDQAPFGMSVLSPDERKQLKEFIESYKTIKKEIASLLEKAGKNPKIMEGFNIKKEQDEEVPAERPAHYNEPTKTPKHNPSNLGGNRTGLVMTKAEMWEGEESIEKALGEKLHSTFNKVTQMAIKQIVADGFDPSEAVSFLKMEIEHKAKESTLGQYDF